MEDTYRLKAITLYRQPFRENDLNITMYSSQRGKQSLVARGARKFKSKLAAHLEPICLTNMMAVRGKGFDYVGSAISENCFIEIKNDLDRVQVAAQTINFLNKQLKEGEKDEQVFDLFLDFLNNLNRQDLKLDYDLMSAFFKLKFFSLLGFKPGLYECAACGDKLKPGSNRFDFIKSGVICSGCFKKEAAMKKNIALTITDDCVKVLRLAIESDLYIFERLKIKYSLKKEIAIFVKSFVQSI